MDVRGLLLALGCGESHWLYWEACLLPVSLRQEMAKPGHPQAPSWLSGEWTIGQ